MTLNAFRELALSFNGASEKLHFGRSSFRTNRIFATVDLKTESVNLKLTSEDQSVFCGFGDGSVYPVPNKWGNQGWTTLEITNLPDEIIRDATEVAYRYSLKK